MKNRGQLMAKKLIYILVIKKHVPGWVGGWMDGGKSCFKDCLQQSKKSICSREILRLRQNIGFGKFYEKRR